jgi:hypothetical protein
MSWEDFDQLVDNNLLNDVSKEVEKNKNGGDFEELPLGKYEIKVNSLELSKSKAGDPMLKACFKVIQGKYTNRLIFMNQVIFKNDNKNHKRLGMAIQFLKSLDTSLNIQFENFSQFDQLIVQVMNEIIDQNIEYLIEINENNNYRNYKIIDVYEE